MRDQTIICIAPRRWDALWKETQAIMSRLAAHNRVLYFEPGRDPEHGVVAEMSATGRFSSGRSRGRSKRTCS